MTQNAAQVVAENAASYAQRKAELIIAVAKHDWDRVEGLANSLYSYKSYLQADGVDVTKL